jgi:hypothetical protein
MSQPRVSVILPVYNGREYLAEAINSVLSQSYGDFELIAINDGSTDGSGAVLEKITDPRLRVFHQSNQGLAATLNRGIALAQGKYIARQDQDDVCFPERFQKQIEFLDAHPEIGMVGTAAEIWVGNERTDRLLAHPTEDAAIKFGMLFNNYFVHSSMMIRRAVFDTIGVYSEDKSRQPPEDYELWSRVIRSFKVANLPDVLLAYREVPSSMSRTGANPFLPNLLKISAENIARATGQSAESPAVIALSRLLHKSYDGVSHGIRYRELRDLVDLALQGIVGQAGETSAQLSDARRETLRKLLYYYVDWRSGGLLGCLTGGALGSRVRTIVKRMLGMRS